MLKKLNANHLLLFLINCSIILNKESASASENFNSGLAVVGYWGTWAAYRPGEGMFEYDNIDVNLFTHLIYCFFGVTPQGEITYLDEWLDIDRGFIKNFIALKSRNPNCKMMASVGGWNVDPILFSKMAATPATRSAFARNTLDLLNRHGFDGEKFLFESNIDGQPTINRN